ncbi:MAG: hypothetical protein JWM80_3458, partial [Cyanobacteria bacterium RYN_339]|nr:hypothetical protein [Cyanobacteria bacterium RYN_339]
MNTPLLPPRYELLGPLGEGGMGVVSWVLDRETGREVALKQLRVPAGTDVAQARFLFRQEFWSMTSLRHPNLVEALDFGEGPDGTPYMSMAMIPGHDLTMGRSESDVRSWLPGVAAALAYLHGRGFVHGDLKPDNIRLQPDGTATLMDLGLLLPAGRAGEPIRGSIDYMAPEVIRQGATDARSDLYALGALLYHALTGRPPFEHADPIVVLRAHLGTRPARLQTHTSDASPEMDAAVMKLLAKEPAQRFSSVAQLLSALGMEAVVDEAAGLLASPVIGRDEARAALREPMGKKAWLVGPAGAGKSRLLGEARAEAQLAGSATVWLQGAGADAAPYQAALPLLRALAAEARDRQPALAPVLARVLPEVGVAPAEPLDGVSERLRLQATVATLARAVYPKALWLVDNADALDPASQELFQALQKEQAADWTWFFAAEAAPAGANVVALEALPDAAIVAIATQQLGQDDLPPALVEKLIPLAAGLPGAVEALLGHWIEQDALVRATGRWQANGTFELPGGLRVALDARLTALGEDARELAQTAAILGATGDLRWLAGIAGLPDDRFFKALRELVAADVLGADERTFRFPRAGQAVALTASWSEDDRRRLNDAAADWLAADTGRGPAEATLADALAIAGHRLAGHTPQRAVPWVLAAAAGAIAQFTLEPAEALLTWAVALPDLPAGEQLALERLQANVWRHQGRAKDALGRYEEAKLLERLQALDPAVLAEETTNYGALLSVAGRYDDARGVLGEAVTLADGRGDPAA